VPKIGPRIEAPQVVAEATPAREQSAPGDRSVSIPKSIGTFELPAPKGTRRRPALSRGFFEGERARLEAARESAAEALRTGGSPQVALARLTEAVDRIVGSCDERIRGELGEPPVAYSIVAAGSYARLEISPYSDLDYAIVLDRDTPAAKSYFTRYAARLEKLLERIDGKDRLHTCDLLSPSGKLGEALLDTPANLAARAAGASSDFDQLTAKDRDYIQTVLSCTRALPKIGDPRLGEAFRAELERHLGATWPKIDSSGPRRALLDRILLSLRDPFGLPEEIPGWPKAEHVPLDPEVAIESGKVNLKHDLMKALQIPLFALRVIYGIEETSGSDVLDALAKDGHLDRSFAAKLKETHLALLAMRVRNHLAVGRSDDRLTEISPADRRAIRRAVPLLYRLRQTLEAFRHG
jgi:hypothetical protein